MQKNFNAALAHVLLFEGAYSDHPLDPGGATNLGITQAVLQSYRGQPVSKDDVRALTKKEAAAIYRKNYWEPACCGSLPSGVDFAVFDCAVNQGVGRASRFLQQATGIAPRGAIGPKTLAAASAAKPDLLLIEFMARRMHGYGLLQKLFKVFGLGWSRRLTATHAAALALVVKRPAADATPSQNP